MKYLTEAMMESKQYKCHKIVRSAKILSVNTAKYEIEIEGHDDILLAGKEFFERHDLSNGGYLVMYDDLYLSVSPVDVFNKGYKEIDVDQNQYSQDIDPSYTYDVIELNNSSELEGDIKKGCKSIQEAVNVAKQHEPGIKFTRPGYSVLISVNWDEARELLGDM